jgi:peptidoglycan/xylan/chitin deacetylase (PgdA/CDA1 family)
VSFVRVPAIVVVCAAFVSGAARAETKEVKPKPQPITELTADPELGKASRVEGEEVHGVVAFTFDDGPNPPTTPAVVDALEKYDVPATFFIVTQRLLGKGMGVASREILARELAAGFTVGDHSTTHPNLGKASGAELDREIDASIRTLAKEAGRPIGLFRPPYGALSPAGRVRLKKLGLTEVIWSIDTLDWRAHDPGKLRKKVLRMILAQNGGIVLMHDVKPITAKIIADVLDDLEAENCRRLEAKEEPIVPVSIHYFLRDGKRPRPVPEAVEKRTAEYKKKLPGRCAKRPPPPVEEKTAKPKQPKQSFGDLGKGDLHNAQCIDNPLAKGC